MARPPLTSRTRERPLACAAHACTCPRLRPTSNLPASRPSWPLPLLTPAPSPPPTPSAIADGLVFLTQRTARDLQLLPLGEWDSKAANADVPSQSMYGGVNDRTDWILRNATCAWARNTSVSTSGGCPADMGQLCSLDFSSYASAREAWKGVREVFGDGGGVNGALIGGIVAGVVGGLGLIGGLVAFLIIRQKRRAAAEDTAFDAKFGAGGGGGKGAALPITASVPAGKAP